MTPEVLQRVDVLAAKLGVAGEHVWAVLVRQAHLEVLFNLAVAVACGYALRKLILFVRAHTNDDDLPVAVLGALGIAIVGMFFLAALGYALTAALNPEYWALQQILEALK